MNVLQRAFAVVGDVETKVRLEARVPCLRYVFDLERPFQQLVLQLEAEQDMHVVRDLVGLDADERGLRFVDRAVERRHVHTPKGFGKDRLKAWVKVAPERQAAADHVFPQP